MAKNYRHIADVQAMTGHVPTDKDVDSRVEEPLQDLLIDGNGKLMRDQAEEEKMYLFLCSELCCLVVIRFPLVIRSNMLCRLFLFGQKP